MAEFSKKQLEQLNEIFGTPLNKLSQGYGELRQQIGAVNERQIRKEVAQLHGETFARGRVIMSLEDLARFVQDCDLGRRASAEELTDATKKLASVLLTSQAPERFIRRLHTCISTVDTSKPDASLVELHELLKQHPWFDAEGVLDTQSLGRWIGKLGDNHSNLRKVVGGVKRVVNSTTPYDELLASDLDGSTGILLAQFDADEEQYCASALRKYEDLELPSWRVQCDVQGNIMMFDAKAQLSVGEVKSSSSGFGDGVVQLVRRLALMQWAVKQLRPAIKEFFKVGHLYMPRDDSKSQNQRPTTRGNVLIYVHYM